MGRKGPEEPNFGAGPLFDNPPHNGTPTSIAAAESVKGKTATMRGQILVFIRGRGDIGATREDVEIALEMRGSTVRPRVLELLKAGTIRELEATRATESGRQAVVLVAT